MATVRISSPQDLLALASGAYGQGTSEEYLVIYLDANINMLNQNWSGLTGTWYMYFYGQNHIIDNLSANVSGNYAFVMSLHGCVQDLYFKNMDIKATGTAAGLVDVLTSGSYLNHCKVQGNIQASSNACGFVRRGNTNSNISKCLYIGNVISTSQNAMAFFYDRDTSSSSLSVFASEFHGNLKSNANNCSIFGNGVALIVNCEFHGSVFASKALYYLANGGIIINCLAFIAPASTWASVNNSGTAYNSYYDAETLGRTISEKIIAATYDEMTSPQWLNMHLLPCVSIA